MAEFSRREDVERWIRARPEASRWRDAAILASRAALRVWPLLVHGPSQGFAGLNLAGVWANALARAAAKYPGRASEIRAAAATAAAAARHRRRRRRHRLRPGEAADVAEAVGAAADAFAALRPAATAAAAAAEAADDATYATYAAAFAADAAADAFAAAVAVATDEDAWKAIWQRLSADATTRETFRGAASVLELPLWGEWGEDASRAGRLKPAGMPSEINTIWTRLRAELPKRADENWQVWLDWYDSVLNGRPPWPALSDKQREDLTMAIALISDKIWKRGPALANAEVKRLIDEAHAKVEKPPEQKEAKSPIVPPPKPAAIEPTWRRGQLIASREAIAADLSPEVFLAALRAARADCFELVRDVRAEVEEAERHGRTPNLDLRPANYLERAASRIGDAVPNAMELFRFGHAAEALRHGLKAVEETWPDFLAARYGLLVTQLERAARQAQAWRALLKNAADDAPPREVVEAAPRYAVEFAEILREADATGELPLIAASMPDGLDALAAIAGERAEIAGSATPAIDAGAEALAVDLIDSIDNIVKKLAEAWLAARGPVGAVARKTGAAFGDGLSEDLPKQSKKLGKLMARIAVWGPMVAGAGFLAEHFAWFAPIAKLLMKAFAG
jgi:hypothetical protein